MKILATGAGGMLGSAMVPALVGAGHDVLATDILLFRDQPWGWQGPSLRYLDVRAADEVNAAIEGIRPDLVMHLAAETSLEVCETDPAAASQTNAMGTRNVALACRDADIPLVYISTAGVFDGDKDDAYTEDDEPNPINAYGATKLTGEHHVQDLLERYYVIRAGWMVGGGPKDHKFVARIVNQLKAGATVIHAVDDKSGTPTYAPDFSQCFLNLLATDAYGTYHMACEGQGTRFDVAQVIVEELGCTDVEVVAVSSDYFKKEFFAPRPPSEIMRNARLEASGLNSMRPWRIALKEYLHTHFADQVVVDLTQDIREEAPAPC